MSLDAGIGANSASGSFDIGYSVKLEADNTERMSLAYPSTGSRTTQTISVWVKRVELSTAQVIWESGSADNHESRLFARFQTDDKLRISTATTVIRETQRKFRDTAAWYHIVFTTDTTQSTAANRHRMYINGVEETEFTTSGNMNQNQNTGSNIGTLSIGYSHIDTSAYFCGYASEFAAVESAVGPTAFGGFDADTAIWKPKKPTATYGTRGAYLTFDDSSALGDDSSGNGNDFALSNIAAADQATDTPTNNFCIMNNNSRTNGNIRTSNGGTYTATDGGSGWVSMLGTMGVAAGKWYWEGFYENNSDAVYVFWGISAANDPWIPHRSGGYYLGNVATGGSLGWYGLNSSVYNGTGTWTGMSYSAKLMFALDCDNGKLYFGAGGTWGNSSNPATNSNGINYVNQMSGIAPADEFILPALSVYQGCRSRINFGGIPPQGASYSISSAASDANGYGTFEYAPPSGFYALCSKNLAEFG